MRTQILDIEDFEPGSGNLIKYARNMRHLAARKHQPGDELAAGRARRMAVPVGCGDAMMPSGRNSRAIVLK
jgi:hypothetical protein